MLRLTFFHQSENKKQTFFFPPQLPPKSCSSNLGQIFYQKLISQIPFKFFPLLKSLKSYFPSFYLSNTWLLISFKFKNINCIHIICSVSRQVYQPGEKLLRIVTGSNLCLRRMQDELFNSLTWSSIPVTDVSMNQLFQHGDVMIIQVLVTLPFIAISILMFTFPSILTISSGYVGRSLEFFFKLKEKIIIIKIQKPYVFSLNKDFRTCRTLQIISFKSVLKTQPPILIFLFCNP